jgi:hypothetical protein
MIHQPFITCPSIPFICQFIPPAIHPPAIHPSSIHHPSIHHPFAICQSSISHPSTHHPSITLLPSLFSNKSKLHFQSRSDYLWIMANIQPQQPEKILKHLFRDQIWNK